ncbi:peroxynitrite isomerase THAP4-like [Hydra vulgaris]|uniref:peroxynitrite isomerase THAP4-like n=1 Tax=Hydra vulgaris TaxID=6087 RepID=UPI001F5F6133|nr:peroxynitrite isomerase THAP4-like [Hydra vulgaris]
MPGCAAVGCHNRPEKGFIMKCFSRNEKQRAIWTSKDKRLNWIPTNTSFLCEVHFDADQWEKTREDGSRKLKHNAIPTAFKHVRAKHKRKNPLERFPIPKKKKISFIERGEVVENVLIEVNNNEVSESVCTTVNKSLLIQDLNAKLERLEKKVINQKKKLTF